MRRKETRKFCCNSGLFRNSCIDSRLRIGAAALKPLRQREKPLYEIVNGFQLIIWPRLNLVEVTAAMIWFFSAVKPDDPSVRKGKISRRNGFFSVHEFRSASLGRNKIALNTTDCGNFTTQFPNCRMP